MTTYWLNGEADRPENETNCLMPSLADQTMHSQPLPTRSVSQLVINKSHLPHANSISSLRSMSQSQRNIVASDFPEPDPHPSSPPNQDSQSLKADLNRTSPITASESKDIPNSVVVHGTMRNSDHMSSLSHYQNPSSPTMTSSLLDSNSNNKGPMRSDSS